MLYPNDVFIRFSTAANIQQDAKSLNLTATIGKMF